MEGGIVLGETPLFADRGFVVTAGHAASATDTPVRAQTGSWPSLRAHGGDCLLDAVRAFVVDYGAPIAEARMSRAQP